MQGYTGIDCRGNRWTFPNLSVAMHQAWELARFYALPAGQYVFAYNIRPDYVCVRVRQSADAGVDGNVLIDLYGRAEA